MFKPYYKLRDPTRRAGAHPAPIRARALTRGPSGGVRKRGGGRRVAVRRATKAVGCKMAQRYMAYEDRC